MHNDAHSEHDPPNPAICYAHEVTKRPRLGCSGTSQQSLKRVLADECHQYQHRKAQRYSQNLTTHDTGRERGQCGVGLVTGRFFPVEYAETLQASPLKMHTLRIVCVFVLCHDEAVLKDVN